MKTIITKFSAMLMMALLAISAQAQNFATAPTVQASFVQNPVTLNPVAQTPIVQQPNATIKLYRSSGKTHGSITVNPSAYRIGGAATQVSGSAYKTPVNKAPLYKAPVATGGGLSKPTDGSLSGTISGSVPVVKSGLANSVAAYSESNDDDNPWGDVHDSGNTSVNPGPFQPGGGVPIGGPFVPFIIMLLMYALFLLVRGDVRDEQEIE